MTSLVAVLDTCVLFPQTLRDLLLRAAEAGLYRPRWSDEILDELWRNLQEERGLSPEQARHLLGELRRAFPEAMVTGYDRLIGDMTNAPKDRHVLAAAVRVGAPVIVTDNVKDFPEEDLVPFGVEARTGDEFLKDLYDFDPDRLARIIVELNAARKRPPEPLRATLERLARATPKFVAQVRIHPAVALRLKREYP
jgi:hypothetical protein